MRAAVPVLRCPTCEVPLVLRWAITLDDGGARWLYQRDCKHKVQPPTELPEETAVLVFPDPQLRLVFSRTDSTAAVRLVAPREYAAVPEYADAELVGVTAEVVEP